MAHPTVKIKKYSGMGDKSVTKLECTEYGLERGFEMKEYSSSTDASGCIGKDSVEPSANMEALIASKLNPHKVQRTSLTIHMHEASVTLHAAINGIKPALMKRKMLREIEHGKRINIPGRNIDKSRHGMSSICCF